MTWPPSIESALTSWALGATPNLPCGPARPRSVPAVCVPCSALSCGRAPGTRLPVQSNFAKSPSVEQRRADGGRPQRADDFSAWVRAAQSQSARVEPAGTFARALVVDLPAGTDEIRDAAGEKGTCHTDQVLSLLAVLEVRARTIGCPG
jgi:hypothetical protein